jgi:transposase
MDETSTNVWETRSKVWQPTKSVLPMVHSLPKNRGSNITIIGAISNQRDQIYSKIANTTNTENVLAFFSNLNSKIKLKDKIIVMDNHASHHSNQVLAYLEKHGAIVLFMPPLSSYFNPIETVWSFVKQKWRNELVKLLGAQPSK